jgi:methylthioribulose-1-phosphate dehydratase
MTARLLLHSGMARATASPRVSASLAAAMAEVGAAFHARGWLLGTSGNLSVVLGREPLRLAITQSGVDKGALRPQHILTIDETGAVRNGKGHASDESGLHLAIVRRRPAGAVLHTHSVWSTLVSEAHAAEGGVHIEGYEMLKGLAGVRSHDHREGIPILANSQDYAGLTAEVERTLDRHPGAHGFLLHRHGLYTWGRDLQEAKRHVEILEFLFEVRGRQGGPRPSRADQVREETWS